MSASRSRRRTVRWVIVGVLVVCCSGLSYYLQVKVPDVGATERFTWWVIDANMRTTLLWVGVVATGVAVLAPVLQGLSEAVDAAAARAATVQGSLDRQTEVNGVLTPMAILLGQLSDLDGRATMKRAELHGEARRTILAGLANLMGGTAKVRACFFEMSGEAGSRNLTPRGTWGRPDVATNAFDEGTAAGDEALAAIDNEEARYWSKGQSGSVPPGWDESKAYTTYISVPVATTGKVHGMLTVDAPEPDTFAYPEDVQTVELLARLLAAALSS